MPTMLFVDDDAEDAREIWGEPLCEDFNWSVTYATGYLQALEILQTWQPDVAILDRRMPNAETGELQPEVGDELLKQIIAHWPHVCPIMLTHNADVESAKVDTRRGAYEYFSKTVPYPDLDRACRNGMKWIRIKQSRSDFIGLLSEEEVFRAATRAARLEGETYCFGYVEISPKGSLVLKFADCPNSALTIPHADRRFLADTPEGVIEEIITSRQPRILDVKDMPSDLSLSGDPAIRLLVPVVAAAGARAGQVIGLLWLESTSANTFIHSDASMFEILANHVAEAFLRISEGNRIRVDASQQTRQSVVAETARSIADPLQSAQTDLELLLSDFNRPEKASHAQRVTDALHSLEQSVQATVEPDLEISDLAQLVRYRAEAMRPRAKAEKCNIDPSTDDWPVLKALVKLNPSHMQFVLDCILENAIDAITAWRRDHTEPHRSGEIVIRMMIDPGRKEVMVSIVDNGTGIDRALLPRIFDRYFTTKAEALRDGKRSLGLFLVKRMVEAFGGEVEAWNAPKGGAEFTFIFPLANAD
jgi:signal transduction histidine kinase/ActR/RegA family two-component response regulator